VAPDDVIDMFRSEMSDQAEPYLWPTADLYRYLDDAQRQLCRRTDGIADATTSEVCRISVEPGTDWVDLHPSIKRLRSVTRADDGRGIDIVDHENLIRYGRAFGGPPGRVRALVTGMEANKARVFPASDETVELELTVFRLPMQPITEGSTAFEVAEEHHDALLLWMKHRAYLKQDAETYDRAKASEFENLFVRYCAQVQEEERRKAFKVRTVAYGGI
jgi:hypothetical protein